MTVAVAAKHESALITQNVFEEVIGGMIKQAVEKLEPVREAAALALARLRHAGAERIWEWEGHTAMSFIPTKEASVPPLSPHILRCTS